MSKITIKKVFSNIKDTKHGPKTSIGLKVEEEIVTDINGEEIKLGERFINGWFPKDFTFPFQEGDIVNILMTTRDEYVNFKLPESSTSGDMTITSRVLRLEAQMKQVLEGKEETKEEPKEVEATMDGPVSTPVDPTEPVVSEDPGDF